MYTHDTISTDLKNEIKSFLRHFSSNYFLALKFFPKKKREDVKKLYCFFRYADELVDNPEKYFPCRGHENLEDYVSEWNNVFEDRDNLKGSHFTIRACFEVCVTYDIPFTYAQDFLVSMTQDTHKMRYKTYKELEEYMWGSASVVGFMMMSIIGFSGKPQDKAKSLAEAMQLTNFIRDIQEDYEDRGRIYVPQEYLIMHGVTEEDIKKKSNTKQVQSLIYFLCKKAGKLFEEGFSGITQLKKSGAFGVGVSARIYRHHLLQIKKRNYDVFDYDFTIPAWRKILLAFGVTK